MSKHLQHLPIWVCQLVSKPVSQSHCQISTVKRGVFSGPQWPPNHPLTDGSRDWGFWSPHLTAFRQEDKSMFNLGSDSFHKIFRLRLQYIWCKFQPQQSSNKEGFPQTEDGRLSRFSWSYRRRPAGFVGKAGFWMAPPTVQRHVAVNKMRTINRQPFTLMLSSKFAIPF